MAGLNILEEFEIFELIGADVEAFAAGQPVSAMKTIGSETYSLSVVKLAGPVAPYQEFTGSFFNILGLVLADAAAFAAGAPIQVAEKVGATWYGETLSVVPKNATEVAPEAVAAPEAPPA